MVLKYYNNIRSKHFFKKISFFMEAPGIDKTDKLLVSSGSGESQH